MHSILAYIIEYQQNNYYKMEYDMNTKTNILNNTRKHGLILAASLLVSVIAMPTASAKDWTVDSPKEFTHFLCQSEEQMGLFYKDMPTGKERTYYPAKVCSTYTVQLGNETGSTVSMDWAKIQLDSDECAIPMINGESTTITNEKDIHEFGSFELDNHTADFPDTKGYNHALPFKIKMPRCSFKLKAKGDTSKPFDDDDTWTAKMTPNSQDVCRRFNFSDDNDLNPEPHQCVH